MMDGSDTQPLVPTTPKDSISETFISKLAHSLARYSYASFRTDYPTLLTVEQIASIATQAGDAAGAAVARALHEMGVAVTKP